MYSSVMSEEASVCTVTRVQDFSCSLSPIVQNNNINSSHDQNQKSKKKRNLPGNPDPEAEVITLSPKTLLATKRFICEICNKGFQRDQNLQLHRRGHNLPWKLKQRTNKESLKKRAYVCPEPTCIHHHPSRALGDLTGIKKHYCRKHGEKKWKCEKCSKVYAVQSDWKAHSKTCGTKEYKCDCGTIFSRKDNYVTHRAFCEALAEESARLLSANSTMAAPPPPISSMHGQLQGGESFLDIQPHNPFSLFQNPQPQIPLTNPWEQPYRNPNPIEQSNRVRIKPETIEIPNPSPFHIEQQPPAMHKGFMVLAPLKDFPMHGQPSSDLDNMGMSRFDFFMQGQPNSNLDGASMSRFDLIRPPVFSATALLEKASIMGARATGRVDPTMAKLDRSTTSDVNAGVPVLANDGVLDFPLGNLAMWEKSNCLTRDFLGLAGGGQSGRNISCTEGNGNCTINVKDMLSFNIGDVGFPPHEAWGNC